MSQIIKKLMCPIKNGMIDYCECQDIQFVADNSADESLIDFLLTENDKNTCMNCPKRIDPAS